MPYRRAYKRPRYGKRDKYSIQQKASVATVAANQTSVVDIVPATTTEGMRKVKHLTCNLTQVTGVAGGNAKATSSGRSCMSLKGQKQEHSTSQQQAQLKQHVRTQPVCHELRRHRPYSRSYQDLLSYLSNLNDGDKISLLIRPTLDGAATIISLCVRYAITLN